MSAIQNLNSTIVAPATPTNQTSALGIVRVSGELAFFIGCSITKRKNFSPRYMHLSNLFDRDEECIDQGLVVFFPGPHSSTGEDVLELHTHGNPLIINKILATCCQLGARLAEPGEFIYRAFWHGKYDLSQVEGISLLIHGRSEQAVLNGVHALQGGVAQRVRKYAQDLKGFRCQLESALDFSDQEDVQDNLVSVCQKGLQIWINKLSQEIDVIRNMRVQYSGIELCLIGPPNAGKSSLLNALADEEVAIIDDQPGTTRDLIRKSIVINGVPVTLCDTAGLRLTQCRIESKGVDKAREVASCAQAVVYVSPDGDEPDFQFLPNWEAIPAKKYLLLNKVDNTQGQYGRRAEHKGFNAVFGVSLKTRQGLAEWLDFISKDLLASQTEESGFLATARQQECLQITHQWAQEALSNIHLTEIAAEALKEAQQSLGKITGEYSHDDLLGDIFSNFCIGK